MTAEACVCNTLAISLLVAGKSLGLSVLCGKARYRCDVCCTLYRYQGSTAAGATTNYLIRSCICISHILVYAIDPTHGLFEMSNSIDMGDPHWLANHLVDVCMCFIHHYSCLKRGSVVLITVTSYHICFYVVVRGSIIGLGMLYRCKNVTINNRVYVFIVGCGSTVVAAPLQNLGRFVYPILLVYFG